jgi:hypothetical protein
MQECSRLILELRAAGWTDKQINDFILYIETGNNQYKPTGLPTAPSADTNTSSTEVNTNGSYRNGKRKNDRDRAVSGHCADLLREL